MLFVLFVAGISTASLSENFNKNPDLYNRILLKLDDSKPEGYFRIFILLVRDLINLMARSFLNNN